MSKQKNVLKCEKKVMISVDYNDLDRFIQDEFNLPNFELVADEELNNDTTKTFNVDAEEMNQKELVGILRGTKSTQYQTRQLLCQLCFEGKLEAGEYAVNISW